MVATTYITKVYELQRKTDTSSGVIDHKCKLNISQNKKNY